MALTSIAIIDYAGMGFLAASGAVAAAERREDAVTFIFFGTFTGVGGGTLRDLLIGAPVFWVANPNYLVLCVVASLFVWVWPPLFAWPYVLGMGVCAMLGHISLVRGYAATDASLAMTFEFSRLPFVVLLGYLAFAETIDAWTWIGALIIFASAIYITRRESRLSVGRS